ncbi:MAG: hypothetical protein ACTSX1_02200 [Candidatus Heimdallarchaeaceae archaeon]
METLGVTEKLQFEIDKNTRLVFNVSEEGIGKGTAKYIFTLTIEEIEYSFPAIFDINELIVEIPALNSVIPQGIVGTFMAKIEVIVDDKIYLKPWEEAFEIYSNPKIDVTLEVVPPGKKVYLKEGPTGPKGDPGKEQSKEELISIIKSVIDDEIDDASGGDKQKFKKIKLRILEDIQDRL